MQSRKIVVKPPLLKIKFALTCILINLFCACDFREKATESDLKRWYDRPAEYVALRSHLFQEYQNQSIIIIHHENEQTAIFKKRGGIIFLSAASLLFLGTSKKRTLKNSAYWCRRHGGRGSQIHFIS